MSINIAKWNGPATGPCALCGNTENTNHVFFLCPLARFTWSIVREAAGVLWDPRSSTDLVGLLDSVQGQLKRVMWTSIGALLWSLWLTHNKHTIEGILPSHPANIIYKCSILMQQWSPLAKRKNSEIVKHAQERIHQVYVAAREPVMPA